MAESRTPGQAWDEVAEEARQAVKKHPKHIVVAPSAELTAKWQAAVARVTDAWVEVAQGRDKVLAAFRETFAKVKAGQ